MYNIHCVLVPVFIILYTINARQINVHNHNGTQQHSMKETSPHNSIAYYPLPSTYTTAFIPLSSYAGTHSLEYSKLSYPLPCVNSSTAHAFHVRYSGCTIVVCRNTYRLIPSEVNKDLLLTVLLNCHWS